MINYSRITRREGKIGDPRCTCTFHKLCIYDMTIKIYEQYLCLFIRPFSIILPTSFSATSSQPNPLLFEALQARVDAEKGLALTSVLTLLQSEI